MDLSTSRGSEKMKDGNEMNELNEASISLLPELTDDDKDMAESQANLDWACGLMEYYYHGAVHKAKDLGLMFQVIKDSETGTQGIRVLFAYDEESCLKFLAMLEHTFEYAGFTVSIEPHMVLSPVTPTPAPSPDFVAGKSNDEGEMGGRFEEEESAKPRNKGTAVEIGMEVV